MKSSILFLFIPCPVTGDALIGLKEGSAVRPTRLVPEWVTVCGARANM